MRMNIDYIEAVIFDMDGVIVDSEPIHERAEREVFLEFGMKVPRGEWDNFRGRKLEDIFSYVRKEYGLGNEPVREMMKKKIERYFEYALTEMRLVPGVLDFLERLQKAKKNYRVAIATSGGRAQQTKILRKFGIEHFFERMIAAEDVTNGKPHPEPYEKATFSLGLSPQKCLVVEDSDNGIISAKSAGCVACGLEGTFSVERLEFAGADFVVKGYTELAQKIV